MVELDRRWQPNDREVSAKVIDGEAIIIRLSDGIYYSMDGAGAVVWTLIEDRRSSADIAAALAATFDVSREQTRQDVVRLLQELRTERLIVVSVDDASPARASTVEAGERAPYVPPALHIYRDMGQLLALDPPAPGLMDIDWKDPGDKA
jgi:hypothetical protein